MSGLTTPLVAPSDVDWVTHPSFWEGFEGHMACRTLHDYGELVAALPPDVAASFAAPCCPQSPKLCLMCTIMPAFIPHLALVGIWFANFKLLRLRRLVQPPGAPVEGYCKAFLMMDAFILQEVQEVRARQRAGVPVIPAHAATLVAAPEVQRMAA